MPKTIGIVGTRSRDDKESYHACLNTFTQIYEPGDRVVSGGCPKGGDRFAEIIAKKYGLTIIIHYPNWNKFGKSAGFQRNIKIAQHCDVLIAVVSESRTGGTEDTIKKAEGLNKQIVLC